MTRQRSLQHHRGSPTLAVVAALALIGCGGGGGGSGDDRDLGTHKTTLTVQAVDADGDALRYEWRVTAGSIENRNVPSTVWTLPEGPGLHFAYVMVSDGKGGYVQQQYAVSSDALDTAAQVKAPVAYIPRSVTEAPGVTTRLRLRPEGITEFAAPGGGTAAQRVVYLPDVSVKVIDSAGGVVLSGSSDWQGEVQLPKLESGQTYGLTCSRAGIQAALPCGSVSVGAGEPVASLQRRSVPYDITHNLRLHGHVMQTDGSVCGTDDAFFGLQVTAQVQLLLADGTAASVPVRINRYGDYAVSAAVPVEGPLKLKIDCEGQSRLESVPASADPAGYVATSPVELSVTMANQRPRIEKMVANGPEGNVRGGMVELAEPGAESNALPGSTAFLTYKAGDSRQSACAYYRALGAASDCDAQGNMVEPISLDDWRRAQQLGAYARANTQVRADYINRMDLNLVRRMEATRLSDQHIAFVVCNHPGPEGRSQAEVDQVLETALAGERLMACVAMEWSTSPGVNGGRPFTKFLSFGPDGSLLPSVNLDGRGEKYMPGACVACHGGTVVNGRFPEQGDPSPYLGSRFLPFATENYAFGSSGALPEAAQHRQFHDLNRLVQATEAASSTATSRLIEGWYASGSFEIDKLYVPLAWQPAQTGVAMSDRLYRGVVGPACRTCHVAMGPNFDWEANPARILNGNARQHYCGGTAELALNASMPNALVSRDRVAESLRADPQLMELVKTHFGCEAPLADPVYSRR